MSPRLFAPQEDGESDVREEEVCGDTVQEWREIGGAHQAVGDVGIDAVDVGPDYKGGAENMAGNNATPAVFPLFPVAIDDVEFPTFVHNHFVTDVVLQHIPYRMVMHESLRQDGYIGWNPFVFGGCPNRPTPS